MSSRIPSKISETFNPPRVPILAVSKTTNMLRMAHMYKLGCLVHCFNFRALELVSGDVCHQFRKWIKSSYWNCMKPSISVARKSKTHGICSEPCDSQAIYIIDKRWWKFQKNIAIFHLKIPCFRCTHLVHEHLSTFKVAETEILVNGSSLTPKQTIPRGTGDNICVNWLTRILLNTLYSGKTTTEERTVSTATVFRLVHDHESKFSNLQ